MKAGKLVRALAGVLLCVAGFVLARASPYRQTTVVIQAGGCRLVTDVVDLGNDSTQGSVILFHGLAANKQIMSYVARGLAQENLRVFVPDLPGHGRTEGPFSFARAEACSESFLGQLISRGAIDPQSTILAGHSMGGTIAVRVAARRPVSGVIAISPAPMTSLHGVPASLLPYVGAPAAPANTLVFSAAGEPTAVRDSARDLIAGNLAASGRYMVIPHSTHVSLLFDPRVVAASQDWAARVLHLHSAAALPSRLPLIGGFAGLAGLLLLAGPFLHEALGATPAEKKSGESDGEVQEAAPRTVRLSFEMAAVSIAAVLILYCGDPLRFVRVFEGSYFASFLLLAGIVLLAVHRRRWRTLWPAQPAALMRAAFAAIVLLLLVTAWLDLTLSEAWMSAARWARFPVLLCATLPYLAAEELLLGPGPARSGLILALLLRMIAWGALVGGILFLHSRAILLVLLALYFVPFSLLQRAGMNIVRNDTGSPLAAALFGAILLAGFCLVIFPIT